ncbi:hypothetical protein KC19_VG186000 [Ceratodon purpureus]|uniref:Uncharacterized protein n=1 Tax=Ceratodon purpureus TaxID=3225 RepID=A0A8T0HRH4_CERPU|nr:hypothetical protein KC19_VG186000 [Ceratodon purpureus]
MLFYFMGVKLLHCFGRVWDRGLHFKSARLILFAPKYSRCDMHLRSVSCFFILWVSSSCRVLVGFGTKGCILSLPG